MGDLKTNVRDRSVLQELRVTDLFLGLLVSLGKNPTDNTLLDSGVEMENTLESLGEHRLQVHQHQLGIEHTNTLAEVVGGAENKTGEEVLELNTLNTDGKILSGGGLLGFFFPHFQGGDFAFLFDGHDNQGGTLEDGSGFEFTDDGVDT